jgi:hypothetical protein
MHRRVKELFSALGTVHEYWNRGAVTWGIFGTVIRLYGMTVSLHETFTKGLC